MKLLDSRKIQTNLNEQRRVDIDNGVKIARQVDTVRNLLAEEESKLSRFRETTIKQVQLEIDSKIKERDSLGSEITELEKERIELLKPLDSEWALVKEEQVKIDSKKEELQKTEAKALKILTDYQMQVEKLKKEEKRISDKSSVAQGELEKAHSMVLEATKTLSDARKEQKRVNLLVTKKTAEMDAREAVLRATIGDIEHREKKIEEDYKFINEEKIRLADQRGVLERAMARII